MIRSRAFATGLALSIVGVALSGCAQSRLRMDTNFGEAVSQDLAAQVADPDAGRNAGPPPAANGQRVQLSVDRYRTGNSIQPAAVGASGQQNAYGANGAGASAPAAPGAGATSQ